MIEGADGQYYLQAGAVLLAGMRIFFTIYLNACPPSHTLPCFVDVNAGWWRLEDKVGLPLDAIHTTGNIPHCTLRPALFPSSPTLPHAHTRTHARTFIIIITSLSHATDARSRRRGKAPTITHALLPAYDARLARRVKQLAYTGPPVSRLRTLSRSSRGTRAAQAPRARSA